MFKSLFRILKSFPKHKESTCVFTGRDDYWVIRPDLGFLGLFYDPMSFADIWHNDIRLVNRLLDELPERICRGKIDFNELKGLENNPQQLPYTSGTQPFLEWLLSAYSYFASACVHAEVGGNKKIPYIIARDLCALSAKIQRPPLLSYASYCLTNWDLVDKKGEIKAENLRLKRRFIAEDDCGGVDESWFILVHVEIEAAAGPALVALNNLIFNRLEEQVDKTLHVMYDSFLKINQALDKMTVYCSPDVYYRTVRRYIFGFENVVYEDVWYKPVTFRGETGAQSSLIPAFQIALGVEHKSSRLTEHLTDMRQYMPSLHRSFLMQLESAKDVIRNFAKTNQNCKELYNACVDELWKFRRKHLSYAQSYIQAKVDDPKGTGGTPYIPWLSQLCDETQEHML